MRPCGASTEALIDEVEDSAEREAIGLEIFRRSGKTKASRIAGRLLG
jgi:hypothetical protein